MKLLNKIIAFSLVLLMIPSLALATNTYSIDLERSSSQYLSITDASQTGLDLSGDNTFELWIKIETLPTAGQVFQLVNKDDATNRSFNFYLINESGTYKLQSFYFQGGAYGYYSLSYSFSANQWYHIALSFDVSNSLGTECVFYINGASQGNGTGFSNDITAISNTSAPFEIGNMSGQTRYFDGLIDDARIWNDVRTAQEISENYQKELVGNETNLVAYWKLNNSLLDETSNNNDLTNNNSATFSTDVPFLDSTAIVTVIDESQIIIHY